MNIGIHDCTSHSCKSWDVVALMCHAFGETIDGSYEIFHFSDFVDSVTPIAVTERSDVVEDGSVNISETSVSALVELAVSIVRWDLL